MDFWKSWNKESRKSASEKGFLPGISIGIILLLIGAYQEQFTDIYRKAIMICLECIGIG